MSVQLYLAYVAACIAVVIVPGPAVTVIIANSLRFGAFAGLRNIAGMQAGLGLILLILTAGFSTIIATTGQWFDIVRLAGAAYLVWLGARLILSDGRLERADANRPAGGFVLQGFLVMLSNPKALLFFGAFIPQFVDPGADYTRQLVFLGVTFMVVATGFDAAYAFASARAGALLSRQRVKLLERMSGGFLVTAGLWLAFSRK